MTRDPMISALERLLKTSLEAWKLEGTVRANDVAGIAVLAPPFYLQIIRAPHGMPFRWVVTVDGRRQTAASVNGVLRIVRQTLTPTYEPLSLRIAPLPASPVSVRNTS